ncbi:MAG: RtcB family protein [Verrucomicrobiae bacterium]|nr:RtcB family protein [Verrucomicrobiae bacterium]
MKRSSEILRQALIDAGWTEESNLDAALECARDYEARGVTDPAYLFKLVARSVPKPDTAVRLNETPVLLAEAITAENALEEQNIGAVRRQLRDFLRIPVVSGASIMPDACPVGKSTASVPVGGVLAAENAIFPSAHSADICCSMFATFFRSDADSAALLDAIVASTRFGRGGRDPADRVHHPVIDEAVWTNPFLSGLQDKARMHMADQGDGNHFAYLGTTQWSKAQLEKLTTVGYRDLAERISTTPANADGTRTVKALVTHHGSRGLGSALYTRGANAAAKHLARIGKDIPEELAWLDYDTPAGQHYWHALQYVSRWTRANHQAIHDRFLQRIDSAAIAGFGNEHNFVWKRGNTFMHGKGATPAWKDENGRPLLGLIPMNMASPILVVLGKDNPDYHSFAPHGAGRNQSRRGLLRQFKVKGGGIDKQRIAQLIASHTRDIDVRWFGGKPDFTETPSAYKDAARVRAQIEHFNLADIVAEIQPLGCVMAGESNRRDEEEELTPKQKRQIKHRADRRKLRQRLHHTDEWPDESE